MRKLAPSFRVFFFWMNIILTSYGAWKLFGMWFILALCLYVAYYAATHKKELALTQWEDYINPLKWGSVLYATFMKFLFPIHIVEQLVLRMYDQECRKCVANGSCLSCGCDISKVYTPWDRCSEGYWGPMIESAEEYKKIREEFPVDIIINYPKESNGKVMFFDINSMPAGMTWEEWIERIKSASVHSKMAPTAKPIDAESLKSEWDKDTL